MPIGHVSIARVAHDPWTYVSTELRNAHACIELITPWPGRPRTTWNTPSTLAIFAEDDRGWRWLATVELPEDYDGISAATSRAGSRVLVTVPRRATIADRRGVGPRASERTVAA